MSAITEIEQACERMRMNAITEIERACEALRKSIAETQQILDVKNAELRGLLRGLEALRAAERGIEERLTAGMLRPTRPPNPVDTVNADPPASRRPSPQPSVEAGTLAYEILGALDNLLETYPKGPTVREIAAHMGEDEKFVRKACQTLANQQRATFKTRYDSGSYHLFPMDRPPPAEDLSPRQEKLLAAMQQLADENGVVIRSIKDLSEAAGDTPGNFGTVMDGLVRKRRVLLVERGKHNQPNTYRILVPIQGADTHERTSA